MAVVEICVGRMLEADGLNKKILIKRIISNKKKKEYYFSYKVLRLSWWHLRRLLLHQHPNTRSKHPRSNYQ